MKVLWFTNCAIAEAQCTGSGSWLFGMRDIISKHVELYNITDAEVKTVECRNLEGVKEYLIPKTALKKNGLPSVQVIDNIRQIVKKISPDVIHIWGLEKYWAKLFAFGYIEGNVLLEIQGVLSACGNVFWGGLTPEEVRKTHRFKEFIKPSIKLEAQYSKYIKKGQEEIILLKKFKHISTQSEWTRLQIQPYIGDESIIYSTLRPIRGEFYIAPKWQYLNHQAPVLFSSLGYNVPFKGMHVLIKVLSLIAGKYPETKLVIAGFTPNVPFYKANGYDRFLKKLIEKYHLTDNVIFPGRLNALQIIKYLLNTDVYVNPTFVESYSAATAEALYMGVPSVLSYAGALPNFGEGKDAALYYSPMDYVDCASKVIKLFKSEEKQRNLSEYSRKRLIQISDRDIIANTQINIYNRIIKYNNEHTKNT